MVGKRKHAATLKEGTTEEDGRAAAEGTQPASKGPRKGRKPPVEVPEPAQLCFSESQPQVCIGTSGYSYKHWRKGSYYPAGLAAAREFSMFSKELNFLEINATFYGWFSEETFDAWRERAAAARPSFRYAVKASQFYTHKKRLNVDQAFTENWARFWERCQRLGPHLGPILFQFPSNFKTTSKRGPETVSNIEKLRQLGKVLPRGQKFVFEFRDASWFCPEVYIVLKEHDWCLSIVEMHGGASQEDDGSSEAGSEKSKAAKSWWAGTLRRGANPPLEEYPLEACSWGVYVRYHGSKGQYFGTYGPDVMARWAQQSALWVASGRTVYHAFSNDQVDEAHNTPSAILDCRHLSAALQKIGTFS